MPRRRIAYLLLLCYLPACTSWHIESGITPEQLITTQHPDTVRVTRTDSARFVLWQPRIAAGDSVSGLYNGVRSRIALSDITQVETQKFSAVKTVGLVTGTLLVSAAIVLISLRGAFEGFCIGLCE